MTRLTRFALPILALLCSAALAQVKCDSTTNLDTNGNVCTNFTTAAGAPPSEYGERIFFGITSEDGRTRWQDFTAGVFITEPIMVQVDIPYDPLLVLQIVSNDGYVHSALNGSYLGYKTVGKGPLSTTCRNQHGYFVTWYTNVYNIADLAPGNPYGYTWGGTVKIRFDGTPHYGRFGLCNMSYASEKGHGELSAVKN